MKRIVIIILEIIVSILLYFFVNSNYIELIPKCWIYNTTKLYCPSCGGTRCMQNIFQGNFIEAFYSNMVIFVGIIYLFIINIVYIFNIGRENKKLTWLYPKWWNVFIFVAILIAYTIVRNVYVL